MQNLFFFFAFCLFRTLHQQSVPCCPLAGLSWMSLNRNISLKEMKNIKNNIKYVFCYFLYECYSNQASKLNIKNINQGLGGPNFQDLKNMSLEAQTWIFRISQYIRQLSTIVVKFCTKKSKFFLWTNIYSQPRILNSDIILKTKTDLPALHTIRVHSILGCQ